jgi:NADPH-dependent glutamate synthase beta subunit-like oxidoreductase
VKRLPAGKDGSSHLESGRITPVYRPQQKEKSAPCQAGCVNCGDIRGWIGIIAQRSKTGLSLDQALERAWKLIVEVNPFPATLGRICPHPCESRCNRSEKDEPVAINAMERFLGDWAIKHAVSLPRLSEDRRNEWLGVIGAGPSGLSFAYQMARRGYRVTVYDKHPKAGGMLRFGVPDFRLPQPVLDAEIQRILDLGVEWKPGVVIGQDVSLEELRNRHNALYLGIGAQSGTALGIPGEKGPSVFTAVDYLSRINLNVKNGVGHRVLVIGGGNSAVDAARCARRTGAQVSILYRRTRNEMPAASHEIDQALEESVQIAYLVAPVRVERDPDGKLIGLVACTMQLGEADKSGRSRPIAVPGSEFLLPCDTIISAISQHPELEGFEKLRHQGDWLVRDEGSDILSGILAGGDALGLGVAGNAIMQGRKAAELLHERLSGEKATSPSEVNSTVTAEQVRMDWKQDTPAIHAPELPAADRILAASAEVSATISEEQFLAETERCFSCGLCFGCEQCAMYCTTGCYVRLDQVGPGAYFSLLRDACHECGKCIEVCPCGFLEMG